MLLILIKGWLKRLRKIVEIGLGHYHRADLLEVSTSY